LTDVVVTAVGGYVNANLRSMWIQDDSVADGRFSGVKVVYNPNSINILPERGMRIDIEGEVLEYFRGTQIQFATITVKSQTPVTIAPKVVSPADIARTSDPERSPWEGVLVRLENAEVTLACFETNGRDRGNFLLEDVVFVGGEFDYAYNGDLRPAGTCGNPEDPDACTCMNPPPNDQRRLGDVFSSVTGVTDFSFGEFKLQPRDDADLVG
jgi:predicted extracellular nuclease